jgi:hypothetical protein
MLRDLPKMTDLEQRDASSLPSMAVPHKIRDGPAVVGRGQTGGEIMKSELGLPLDVRNCLASTVVRLDARFPVHLPK